MVSTEMAKRLYGVILDRETVDTASTAAERAAIRGKRNPSTSHGTMGTDRHIPTDALVHPLREGLAIVHHEGTEHVCCTRCGHLLCLAREDWTAACRSNRLAPSSAGRLMEPLRGAFLLEQLVCPFCAALLETEFVEAP
jgi:hypothetical protein